MSIIRVFRVYYYIFKAMIKYARGGYFCWRDTPTEVVKDFVYSTETEDFEEHLQDFREQAVIELKLSERRYNEN